MLYGHYTLVITRLACAFVASTVVAGGSQAIANRQCHHRGDGFSGVAVDVVACSASVPSMNYASPDGKKVVVVSLTKEGDPQLEVRAGHAKTIAPTAQWPSPRALWSPSSSAIFVNYSTGGNVGNFETRVIHWLDGGANIVDPAKKVLHDFLAQYPQCDTPETPNVASVAWLDANRLLIAAEVLPHSNCDSMGTFATYEVSFPSGQILRKYGQLESKRRFGHLLGSRLLGADDKCVHEPKACWIPMLHRE